jgi:GNAT superfamily N-acetyltransferase
MSAEIAVERLGVCTPEDAAGIGRLMPYLSESFSGEPIPEDLLREIIESKYHEQLVARTIEEQSRIVGAATLSIIIGTGAGKKGWLEDFVSDPESGIKGVGQAVWDEMENWCQEHGVDLYFTSRPIREAAHHFYLKNGAAIRDTDVFEKEFSS